MRQVCNFKLTWRSRPGDLWCDPLYMSARYGTNPVSDWNSLRNVGILGLDAENGIPGSRVSGTRWKNPHAHSG